MRTYLGKFVNNGEAPVFVASVKDEGFDVTEELLRVAAADEANAAHLKTGDVGEHRAIIAWR